MSNLWLSYMKLKRFVKGVQTKVYNTDGTARYRIASRPVWGPPATRWSTRYPFPDTGKGGCDEAGGRWVAMNGRGERRQEEGGEWIVRWRKRKRRSKREIPGAVTVRRR
ncbi:hypothetical protein B296_00036797 [Ensete ventricosum]|uniref:Uncharacterized protein n=1 Tax=Ensete ventricosum TaxID=4639 RepID=A0A427A1B7_ENSVE|nr:hypothetical protein B296_00036797 [Ensete ventricosum]